MGETRIQEVNMVTLFLALFGVIFILAAASRIWSDATPLDSRAIDSAAADNGSESAAMDHLSKGNDSAV